MSAGIVFQQMVIIFLLILTGYIVYKKGIIKGEISKGISALVVNVCNPAILVRSAFDRDPSITYDKLLMSVLGAGVLYAVLIAASFLFPKLLKTEKKWEKHYSLMCLFGNTGFIGIPLVSAVLGSQALIYVAVANAYFNLLFYTYGIWLADGGKSRFSWKNFLNVGNFSIIVTIVLFVWNPKLPAVFTSTIDYMADTTTFLAMVVIGISLARTNLKSIFTEVRLYLFIALRFLALPIAISFLLRLFIKDDTVYGVMVLMASVPVANLPLMRVEETGGDGSMLSKGIILSTLFSLFTIPLVTLFV
ncbi:MAG: AEC family transporter [Eubacteriales bacterium]|nr:AEC family transporter [Eubacteriales bacterium]